MVPRREAALTIAREIEELNDANLSAQRDEVERRHTAFRDDLHRLMWQTVLLGLGVAMVVVVRLRVLERRSDEAELQMRELSQQLVNTQEEERKNLSRELHDHVAQVLTGLRMELGRIERMNASVAPWSPSARRWSTTCSRRFATSRSACAPACWTTVACKPRSNGTSAISWRGIRSTWIWRSTAISINCRTATAPVSTGLCRRR